MSVIDVISVIVDATVTVVKVVTIALLFAEVKLKVVMITTIIVGTVVIYKLCFKGGSRKSISLSS